SETMFRAAVRLLGECPGACNATLHDRSYGETKNAACTAQFSSLRDGTKFVLPGTVPGAIIVTKRRFGQRKARTPAGRGHRPRPRRPQHPGRPRSWCIVGHFSAVWPQA